MNGINFINVIIKFYLNSDTEWPEKKETVIVSLLKKYENLCKVNVGSKILSGKYCQCLPDTACKFFLFFIYSFFFLFYCRHWLIVIEGLMFSFFLLYWIVRKAELDLRVSAFNWSDIHKIHAEKLGIFYGGEWMPKSCLPIEKVAIVIPYRDREKHLKILIHHLHKILSAQQIHYRIFIVEQLSPIEFNKGALMNAGYLEIKKIFNFDCIIFHDVDMLTEDGRHMYNCIRSPRHIGPFVDKFLYKNKWLSHVGGVFSINQKQFEKVNGYNTLFFGWGDEDDDMQTRCVIK